MKYFSIPADFKKETIDEYDRLNQSYRNSRVIETYGNITTGSRVESGRVINQLPQLDVHKLKEYVEYSQRKNIEFNYTINAPHIRNKEFTPGGISRIKGFLRELYNAGVRSLTIALPSLMELAQSTGLDFEVKASTLCQVTNVNKARAFKRLGFERIVVDESIIRDFARLKQICLAVGKVEVIVNPICLKDCIYRMFHYNQVGADSIDTTNRISTNYYEHRCVLQRNWDIANLLRMCWVRPEDLHYYTNVGIHYFKLQGRHLVQKGDILRTVNAYFDENFDGDFMDLITLFYTVNHFKIPLDNKKLAGFIKPFVEKENFCIRDCEKCNYCNHFAKKCLDLENAREVIRLARTFYQEYDQFTRLLREEKENQEDTIKVRNKYQDEDESYDF